MKLGTLGSDFAETSDCNRDGCSQPTSSRYLEIILGGNDPCFPIGAGTSKDSDFRSHL